MSKHDRICVFFSVVFAQQKLHPMWAAVAGSYKCLAPTDSGMRISFVSCEATHYPERLYRVVGAFQAFPLDRLLRWETPWPRRPRAGRAMASWSAWAKVNES